MKVKGIIAEDFSNFKVPSMFISTAKCDWKCCVEAGVDISTCQNAALSSSPTHDIDDFDIFRLYIQNPITEAVVLGGLEPMLQLDEVLHLLDIFRKNDCNDVFVIYTGYYPEEIPEKIEQLRNKNVIVKYGRFVPSLTKYPRFDEVLGVTLVSSNQFAEIIDHSFEKGKK